jgi:predicted nuclease of predicted toxin-antitoxin system
MRVLLDECVPRSLREHLHGHDVRTVTEAGWAGAKNGELLRLASQNFDVVLTVDRNFEYQQSFAELTIAVIVMHAPSNDIAALLPLVTAVLEAVPKAERGRVTNIGR